MKYLAMIALLASGAPAVAQSAPTAPAQPALDPARVAAARILVDHIFPPATREQLIIGMVTPLTENIRQAFARDPKFADAFLHDPKMKALLDSFIEKQFAQSKALIVENLPTMVEAMSLAYARRFDLNQIRDIDAFFATPSGRAYLAGSFTIMSDPDIQAWQRDVMARSIAHVQSDVAEFAQQAEKLASEKPGSGK